MKKVIVLLAFILLIHLTHAQVYITHASVVDVINLKINADETVVIKNDKIINIDKSSNIKVAADAKVIDATGKYLIPGLVDAHVHFFQTGGIYTRPDALDLRKYHPYDKEIAWAHAHFQDFLKRYLSAGITTVIDPGSSINFLKQRDTLKTKNALPAVYMTGPLLTTLEPDVFKNLGDEGPFYLMHTKEDAIKYTDHEIKYKPDFIKIWYIVGKNIDSIARASAPLVKAVIDEAHKHNLRAAVHATELTTATLAVENGADYLVHSVDDTIITGRFVQLLKQHRVVLCPTLQVSTNYVKVFSQQYQVTDEDKKFSLAEPLHSFSELASLPDTGLANRVKRRALTYVKRYARADSIMNVNLAKLVQAGVPIATGTDAGNIGTLHVSSYFIELRLMQQAGMSVPQILQSSTINGAKVLGRQNTFGSIEKGKFADMILLNANPFENLANWQNIHLIINKGELVQPVIPAEQQ
jgi:imidazolonepropionase-like amidohydrolase